MSFGPMSPNMVCDHLDSCPSGKDEGMNPQMTGFKGQSFISDYMIRTK